MTPPSRRDIPILRVNPGPASGQAVDVESDAIEHAALDVQSRRRTLGMSACAYPDRRSLSCTGEGTSRGMGSRTQIA